MSRRFEALLAAAFCVAVGLIKLHPVGNSDLFWHLKVGELTLERGLMQHDPLTFTAANRPWVHHEWAAQVALAFTFEHAGWTGLRVLRAGLIGLTLLVLCLAIRRDLSGSLGVVTLVTAWLCLAPHATLRPHLFGWLLLALVYWAALTRPPPWSKWRWAGLLATVVVWANFHSSVLIVPLLCALQLLEGLAAGPLGLARPPGTHRHWGAAAALTGLATLAQPAGPSLWTYVARTPVVNRPWSTEWAPLFQSDVLGAHPALVVLVVVLGVGTLWSISVSRRLAAPFPGRAVAAFALAAGIFTRRMVFLGFLAAHHVARILGGRVQTTPRRWVARAGTAALALSAAALALPGSGSVLGNKGLADEDYPVAATTFLEQTGLRGHLMNPDYWGGYLGFRLFPRYRTFIDGRWLLVGRQVLQDSVSFQLRRGDVEGLAKRRQIAMVIEPLTVHFHTPALDRSRWVLAHVDRRAVVLLRRGANFDDNLRRVCRYYREHPKQLPHARWPVRLVAPGGAPSPTDIPSALSLCHGRR